MNLTEPLFIEKATISQLPITPTETGFTTVMVIDALATPQIAALVGVGFIYDDHEVARDFDGTIGPEGEISGPIIRMKLRKGEPIDLDTKKVTKIKFTRFKDDVTLSMRIHLADTDQNGTLANLRSLMKIGRSEFELHVTDRQQTIQFGDKTGGPNVPDRVMPDEFFGDKKGKTLKARVMTSSMPVADGERWYWGYDVAWTGKKSPPPFGQLVDLDGFNFEATRDAAKERAAAEIIAGLKVEQGDFDPAQLALSADCMDWILNLCPGLRRDEKGNRGPTVINIARKPDPEEKVEPKEGDSFDESVGQTPPAKRPGRGGPKNRSTLM